MVLFRSSDIGRNWYQDLRSTSLKLTEILDEMNHLRKNIELQKKSITSQLEAAFKKRKNNVLLNLKRDVFNLRLTRLKKYNSESLEEVEGLDLDLFLKTTLKKEQLESVFENQFEKVLINNRRVLQSEVDNEELLKTIIFFNENIYEKLDKYMSVDAANHNKKLKKLDFFLVKLMMRASMKTSPFSFLTKIGSASPKFNAKSTNNVEINHAMVLQMFFGFLRKDAKALQLIPTKVANFGKRDSKIYYVSQHSTSNSKKVFETSDKFIEFQLHPHVIDFLERNKQQEVTFDMFKDYLLSHKLYKGQELKLYQKLVELKVLIQKVNIGANRDILTNMISFLNRYSLNPEFVSALSALKMSISQFETGSVEERRKAWAQISRISSQWTQEKMNFGNEVLFEDIVSKESVVDETSPQITDEFIGYVTDFVLLFDVNIRVQYELASLFHAEYSDETIGLSNSSMLNEIFFNNLHHFYPYYQDINYRYQEATAEEVHVLDDLRDQFVQELKELIDQSSAEELNIKPLIKKYVEQIPRDYKEHSELSVTLFTQNDDQRTVVNEIYDGQEKFLSRFKDFFEQSSEDEDYLSYIEKNYNGKNYYEIDELFGFNGGIHDRNQQQGVNLNIGYQQFQKESRPFIDDFSVMYDDEKRKLKLLDIYGKEARIAYKSSLVPIFLPGILSVMLLLFQSGRLNFDVNGIGKTRDYLPRLSFDDVVMYRQRWNLDHKDIKHWIDNSINDADRYQEVQNHFQQRNLPKQFFMKFYKHEDEFAREKPIFIDVDIPVLFRLFINECKRSMGKGVEIFIEEALPGPETPLKEYMVEYTVDKVTAAVTV